MVWRLEIRETGDTDWLALPWRFRTPQDAALAATTTEAADILTLHKYGPWKLNDDGTIPRDRKWVYSGNIRGRVFPVDKSADEKGWATHAAHHCGDNVYCVVKTPRGWIDWLSNNLR